MKEKSEAYLGYWFFEQAVVARNFHCSLITTFAGVQ
jgi:hypothetical protein